MAVSYPDTSGVSQYFDTYHTSLHIEYQRYNFAITHVSYDA